MEENDEVREIHANDYNYSLSTYVTFYTFRTASVLHFLPCFARCNVVRLGGICKVQPYETLLFYVESA